MKPATINTIGKIGLGTLGVVAVWKAIGPERQERVIGIWYDTLDP